MVVKKCKNKREISLSNEEEGSYQSDIVDDTNSY